MNGLTTIATPGSAEHSNATVVKCQTSDVKRQTYLTNCPNGPIGSVVVWSSKFDV